MAISLAFEVFLAARLLAGVRAVAEQIDRRAAKALERFDQWLGQNERRTGLVLAALILGYGVSYSALTVLRHHFFHSGYDLVNQSQVVWNTAHGRPFARSFEVTNDLADHVRPYLVLLSPICWIVPPAYVLLVFQAFALGLSAWPLYRLGRRTFNSQGVSLALAACLLGYPPLGFLNRFDFHAEIIIVPLLIAAYERLDADDLKKASVWMGLALLGKEDVGVTVAALGLLAAFHHKHWRFGLTWALLGMAYSLIALFVIIPAFRGGPSDTLVERYHWLGHTPVDMISAILRQPGFVWEKIVTAGHALTTLQLLAPLAFVPLCGLAALMPALPALFYHFSSDDLKQGTIYYHYMAPVIPFMNIAAVLGLSWLTTSASGSRLRAMILPRQHGHRSGIGLGLCLMGSAIAASWVYENPVTSHSSHERGPAVQLNHAAVREGIRRVPDGVYLVTTSRYAAHLSERPQIQTIRRAPEPTPESGVEAVFFNLRDLRGHASCEEYRRYLEAATRAGFGVTFYRDRVVLIQRGAGDAGRLRELLDHWPGCE